MNFILFCRFIGRVPIGDIHTPTEVVKLLNETLTLEEAYFTTEMTGLQALRRYEELTPKDKAAIDDIVVYPLDHWYELYTQIRKLENEHYQSGNSSDIKANAIYLVIAATLLIITLMSFVSYFTQVTEIGEVPRSQLLHSVYALYQQYQEGMSE